MKRVAVWLLLLSLAISCTKEVRKKQKGEPCQNQGECGLSMVCAGSSQPVCQLCEYTEGCRQHGDCSFLSERCAPAGDWDCQASADCKARGKCWLGDGRCTGVPPRDPSDPNTDNKEGGCPCGCDHSEELVASLREQDRGPSLAAARASLTAISEREQLGYITDAMVSHRLRLRGLEASLLQVDDVRFWAPLSPRAVASRLARAKLPVTREPALAVQSELLVYGATTDIVHGQPKHLLASFRIWLGLENLGKSRRTLSLPIIQGSVAVDVRRWYLEDRDGEPWDGQLGPGEKRAVLLIGYLDEQIPPGAVVALSLDLDSVKLPLVSQALSSWDAHADPFMPLPVLGAHGARSGPPQNIK